MLFLVRRAGVCQFSPILAIVFRRRRWGGFVRDRHFANGLEADLSYGE
jgi:hypothetical protein